MPLSRLARLTVSISETANGISRRWFHDPKLAELLAVAE
jgi:hypothetical protein